MDAFTKHTGVIVPFDIANIDTDAIIPKQFLQKVTKTGYADDLFFNWRYSEDQKVNENFILNKPLYKKATILLARENFGCGSSREHAPWALIDYGFKVVIAPSFADIFYNNSFHNGLLLVTLAEAKIQRLFEHVFEHEGDTITVDLENKTVVFGDDTFSFELDSFKRYCLLNGLDSIDLTLQHEDAISAYEEKIPLFLR